MSPLFEFYCEPCQLKFEARRSIEERLNAECPKCGLSARRVMSVVNHTFGWRVTDASCERFGPRDEFERDV